MALVPPEAPRLHVGRGGLKEEMKWPSLEISHRCPSDHHPRTYGSYGVDTARLLSPSSDVLEVSKAASRSESAKTCITAGLMLIPCRSRIGFMVVRTVIRRIYDGADATDEMEALREGPFNRHAGFVACIHHHRHLPNSAGRV